MQRLADRFEALLPFAPATGWSSSMTGEAGCGRAHHRNDSGAHPAITAAAVTPSRPSLARSDRRSVPGSVPARPHPGRKDQQEMTEFGFRLYTRVARPDPALVEGFRGAATGHVADALGRSAALDHRVKPVAPGMAFCGVAVTVKARPVDNLVVWKALELAQPGDVLVVATGGHLGHSTWGDLTSRVAAARGLAAMVTDGAVRDVDGIVESGLAVFAAAVTPNSPQKDGPGELNVPVACGGQVVQPGDILVGDGDGVVVVPRDGAEAALAEVRRIREYEKRRLAAIAAGELLPDWVDRLLAERGARVIDGRAESSR
jgi:regulator of RNase E activity RraA